MNYIENDYTIINGKRINFMLIGKPLENKNVLAEFLAENVGFEVKSFKMPFATVYYVFNEKENLYGAGYRHYIKLSNNKENAIKLLNYMTDKSDLCNGL